MVVSDLTTNILETITEELQKEENKRKIEENILGPIIQYMKMQMYPYVLTTSILFILLFVMAAIILYLLLRITISSKITIVPLNGGKILSV